MTQEDEAILLGSDVRRMVKRLARYYTRDDWDYEDSVQNGMLYATNYLNKFPDDLRDKAFYNRLYSYLRGMIGGQMVSRMRYRARVGLLKEPDILPCTKEVNYAHTTSVIPPSVTEAMNHITKVNLECIKLHYLEDMNFEKVGAKLSISRHLARKRAENGINQIRRYLSGKPVVQQPGRKPKSSSSRCSIDLCEQDAKTRGWCPTHYARFLKYGDPNVVKNTRFSSNNQPLKQSQKSPEIGLDS